MRSQSTFRLARKSSLRFAALATVLAGCAFVPTSAPAQIFTWDGGSATTSNWSDALNWATGIPTSSFLNEIRMQGTLRKTNTNNIAGMLRVGKLFLDGGGWFITGNPFEFQAGGMIEANGTGNLIGANLVMNQVSSLNREVTVSPVLGGNLTLSGNITGTGILAKKGTGTLILSGTNTAGVAVYDGQLTAGQNSLGGSIDVKTGALVNWTVGTDYTHSSSILGAGTINKGGNGMLSLFGNNTFTGNWRLTGGSLRAGSGSALGAANVTFDAGSTLSLILDGTTNYTYSGNVDTTSVSSTPAHSIQAWGTGIRTLTGNIEDSIELVGSAGTTLKLNENSITNRLSLGSDAFAELNVTSQIFEYGGKIAGDGEFTKTGMGILSLTSGFGSSGVLLRVQQGSMRANASTFSDSAYIDIAAPARLELEGGTMGTSVVGSGVVRLQGAVTTDFSAAQNAWTGRLEVVQHSAAKIRNGSANGVVLVNGTLDWTSDSFGVMDFSLTGSGIINYSANSSNIATVNKFATGEGAFSGRLNLLNGGQVVFTSQNFSGIVDGTGIFGVEQAVDGTMASSFRMKGAVSMNKYGDGSVTVNGSNLDPDWQGRFAVWGGSLRLKDSAWNSQVTIDNSGEFILENNTDRVWSGVVSPGTGIGTFAKDGLGTLTVGTTYISQLGVRNGTLLVKDGTLTTDLFLVESAGRLKLGGEGSAVNGGVLANGEVTGTGRISQNLVISEPGRAAIGSTDHLLVQGVVGNQGAIQMLGGTLQVNNTFNNMANGFVSGRGTIRAAATNSGIGLQNDGVVSFSGGFSDVFGDVNNRNNGRLMAVGGATVTYHDDVVHNGAEIRTAAGSRTVFLGSLSGAGTFTGAGTVEVQGDLRPGNSPAMVTFAGDLELGDTATTTMELGGLNRGSQYDSIKVLGTAYLGGVLDVKYLNGFQAGMGDTFRLFEGNMVGTFSEVYLPTLQNGMFWNTSQLYTLGQIQAVPEPGSIAAIAIGLGSILLRRKRSR